jgi:hypothetical protein
MQHVLRSFNEELTSDSAEAIILLLEASNHQSLEHRLVKE